MSRPEPQTASEMGEEIKLLRVLLGSAVAHILDLTDCVENGDPPTDIDPTIAVPMGHLADARGAALWIEKRAGLEAE